MNKYLTSEQKALYQQFLAEQLWKDYLLGVEFNPTVLWKMNQWDCSELRQGAYKAIGIDVIDGAANQLKNSFLIKPEEIDIGDGAYMGENGIVTHVGNVYDKNIIIEATYSRAKKVVATNIKDFMNGRGKVRFMCFARFNMFPVVALKPEETGGIRA